jgi:hypothetical protein
MVARLPEPEAHMLLAIAIYTLEGIFAVGVVGCALVLTLTTVEDVRTLFGGDDKPAEP